jgi:hypothetical protein
LCERRLPGSGIELAIGIANGGLGQFRPVLTGAPGRLRRTSDRRCSGTMGDMLVNPLPGTRPEQLQKTLMEQHSAVLNLLGWHSASAQDKLGVYIDWTANAVQQLSSQISPVAAPPGPGFSGRHGRPHMEKAPPDWTRPSHAVAPWVRPPRLP